MRKKFIDDLAKECVLEAMIERMQAHNSLYSAQNGGTEIEKSNTQILAAKADGLLLGSIRGLRVLYNDREIEAILRECSIKIENEQAKLTN